jgi:PAS domain S-box-containing protein
VSTESFPDPRHAEPAGDESPDALSDVQPQAWLSAIIESSDDAIIGKTLDGIIRSWNAAAVRIFGYEPHEIIGESVLRLIPPDRRHEESEIVAHLTRGERVEHFETVRLRKDGTPIDVSLSVSPIRDSRGAIYGAAKIARDISDAKRLQRIERESAEQLQHLASELEQQVEEAQALHADLEEANSQLSGALDNAEASRLQAEEANRAKSQFLAVISHELRTPLNAIAGYVELLEMGLRGPLTDEQRRDLDRIKRSEQALLRLIDDILTFAKAESGRIEYQFDDVRLDELLASLNTMIAPRLSAKGLEYHVDMCAIDGIVRVDRGKVEQIILNLLSNALKFTDTGRITIRCLSDNETFRIDVEDTGCGIPARDLAVIFEPFVQGNQSLTRRAEGTGLGLSISRQFARDMGGDIAVESAIGVGSTFTLSLPRTPNGME